MSSIIYSLFIEKNGMEMNYIGSSMDEIDRMYKHKSYSSNPNDVAYNRKFYQKMREFELEWDDVKIFILERNNIKNKRELEKREQIYIDWLKPTCNEKMAYSGATQKESSQNYYQKHKEYIKARVKLNTEKNKEKIDEYQKQYQNKNKDKIQARKSEKIQCTCGRIIARGHKARHLTSAYHQKHT